MVNNWMVYSEENTIAHKRVEAENQKINLLITADDDSAFYLAIEAGMDSISVNLKSRDMESACKEADVFAKSYFADKARLFEEIADRI